MKNRARLEEIALALCYLGLGLASAILWVRLLTNRLEILPALPAEIQSKIMLLQDWHRQMIAGTAPAPNQYRILTPWLIEHAILPLDPSMDMYSAYMWVRALFTGLALIFFHSYLRVWFSRGLAAAGTLALAAIIPFTYFPVFQESDPLNLLFIVLAFVCVARKKDLWLLPLVLVGTLNRETTLLIPAVYALSRWGEQSPRKVAAYTALLTACWGLVFVGLHLRYGNHTNYTNQIMWSQNLSSGMPTLFAFLVFGVLWLLPWLAPKDAPVFLRRALWLVPPFVALHYIVAVVQEVRLFLPLAPILIPLSWWVLFPEARPEVKPAAVSARAGARR